MALDFLKAGLLDRAEEALARLDGTAYENEARLSRLAIYERAHDWLHRVGPPALLLSWLPAVGDPLCAVAGWLRLSFWPCVFYMAIGKFLRYLFMTAGLLWFFPGQI